MATTADRAFALDDKLVVGISTRALFDLEDAHRVYAERGVEAYRAYQVERERVPLGPGTAYPLARGLLRINELLGERRVEVVLISRNSAETGLRAFHSVQALGLDVTRAAFTTGRPVAPYLEAFSCDLFLSADDGDVVAASRAGFAAGKVLAVPPGAGPGEEEVRIAFDGDAVLFSHASEELYRREGLEAFQRHEAEHADVPLEAGPFMGLLQALCAIQDRFPPGACPVRTALITARDAISQRRVVNTFRAMNVRIDETFFLGGVAKDRILRAWSPHIFFDDSLVHAEPASRVSPTAHVLRPPPDGQRGG